MELSSKKGGLKLPYEFVQRGIWDPKSSRREEISCQISKDSSLSELRGGGPGMMYIEAGKRSPSMSVRSELRELLHALEAEAAAEQEEAGDEEMDEGGPVEIEGDGGTKDPIFSLFPAK